MRGNEGLCIREEHFEDIGDVYCFWARCILFRNCEIPIYIGVELGVFLKYIGV